VVASILLFMRLASVFLIVSSIVLSIVFPRKIPRCLQTSGASIPFCFRSCYFRWGVYAQGCSFSDVDIEALTNVYWLYKSMIGWMSFALLMARGFKLSSAKRMGPTVVFPLVLYIIYP
jgi:hypothetical protein